jgi:hypothetical protein
MAAGDPLRTLEAVASTRLPLNEAVFDWCLRNARGCLARGALEPTLRWSLLAARSAIHHGFGWLASPELERILLVAASQLPCRMAGRAPRSGPVRWLHVMDEAHPIGGHSALVRRWMELDRHGSRHSVMILSQRGAVERRLADAVRVTDGVVRMLDPDAPLMERARQLREEAWSHADRVVLHVHPWSVVPVVALGLPGGPPVMLLNHLSQQFWVGGSVADLVLNLRGSALEWTRAYRGIHRNTILPIPLPDATVGPVTPERRLAARQSLGLPASAVVLLTIGSAYKYRALPGIDFVEAAGAVLRARPDAHLVAVGPRDNERWEAVRNATAGRVVTAGPQHDLRPYHAAADVYLEGFPLGSPTALLEVGQRATPCVRAPRCIPPPFSVDGAALAGVEQPADLADYTRAVIALLDDPQERRRQGLALAASIRRRHSPASWRGELDKALAGLPPRHEVHSLAGAARLSGYLRDFSVALATVFHADDTLTYTVRSASSLRLRPCPSLPVARAFWRCLRADPRAFVRARVVAALLEPLVGAGLVDVMRRARRRRAGSQGR